MNQPFEERQEDMWARLKPVRQLIADLPTAKIELPDPFSREEGVLVGFSFFEPRRLLSISPILTYLFGVRDVAKIGIFNDRGAPDGRPALPGWRTDELYYQIDPWEPDLTGYSIQVWRRWRGAKVAFETGKSLDREKNAEEAAAAMLRIVETLRPSLMNMTLARDFPEELNGEPAGRLFVRHFIEPYRDRISLAISLIGLVIPIAMFAGALLYIPLLMSLTATMFCGALVLPQWIPALLPPERRVGTLLRGFTTITLLPLPLLLWFYYLSDPDSKILRSDAHRDAKLETYATKVQQADASLSKQPDGIGKPCGGDFFPVGCKGELICEPKVQKWEHGYGTPGICQLPKIPEPQPNIPGDQTGTSRNAQ